MVLCNLLLPKHVLEDTFNINIRNRHNMHNHPTLKNKLDRKVVDRANNLHLLSCLGNHMLGNLGSTNINYMMILSQHSTELKSCFGMFGSTSNILVQVMNMINNPGW